MSVQHGLFVNSLRRSRGRAHLDSVRSEVKAGVKATGTPFMLSWRSGVLRPRSRGEAGCPAGGWEHNPHHSPTVLLYIYQMYSHTEGFIPWKNFSNK